MPAHQPPIRAVLFDLDDTLNDRSASWRVFVEFLAGPGGHLRSCDLSEVHARILVADQGGYRPKEQLFVDLCNQLPWQAPMTATLVEALWRAQFPKCMVLRAAVPQVLAELKGQGVRLAIVTNGRTDAQRAKINHMGFGAFLDAVVTSEAAGVKKPDPRIFHSALAVLGTCPSESLFVGDNPLLDVVGPASIGLRTMWLMNGRDWPPEYPPPTFQIQAFSEFSRTLAAAPPGG